jgi:hypothetical protein
VASHETHLPSPLADSHDHGTDGEQALDLLECLLHPKLIKHITLRRHYICKSEGDDARVGL